jgi:hypothetical protein
MVELKQAASQRTTVKRFFDWEARDDQFIVISMPGKGVEGKGRETVADEGQSASQDSATGELCFS